MLFRSARRGHPVRIGFTVGATNPKTIVFFVAFLPQFLDPGRPFWPQMAVFEATFVTLAFANAFGCALLAARVRRLAVEGLTSAGALDEDTVKIAAADPDAQVRRLAMRGAAMSGAGAAQIHDGLADPMPLVRLDRKSTRLNSSH